ncbi:ribonuclease HI [Rhizoctonia solani 123E]|uniref:Ribonuclease HI n=1 Tax=Rhizoctonia solani 123E TaxID=1423351 RepID=A0A074RT44_9AGAM|nr:ribonuclease HI [Rhizoctonia solani 123E]
MSVRVKTLEIRWHHSAEKNYSEPIYACDFQPLPANQLKKLVAPRIQQQGREKDKDKEVSGPGYGQSFRMATGGGDNNIRVWMVYPNVTPPGQTTSPQPARVEYLATLSKHTAAVNVVRFSPNGEFIASAGDDGMLAIWSPSDKPVHNFGDSAEELQYEKEHWRPRVVVRATTREVYDLAWSPNGEPIAESPRKTRPLTRQDLIWGDHVVRTVPQHVFLGVLIDQELRWTAQSHRALAKSMAWASQLGRLARTNFGASPAIARKLYVSIAVPRFTYAADIWYRPVTLRDGQRGSGSIGFAHRLARIQRTAALSILGGLRSTPSASLDAHSCLLPVHLLLNQVCERAALRLASVPNSHPLHVAVRQSSRGRKAHRTPLHDILALLALSPSLISPRQPRNPLVTAPEREFPSKQEAKRAAEMDDTHFRIFTDGSHSQDGVGAAAVLFRRSIPSTTAGLNLGCPCCYSVLDAELAAISLAIHLARSLRFWDDLVIYSDSQAAVKLVDPTHGTPSHALAARVRTELRALRRERPLLDIRAREDRVINIYS